MILRQNSHDAEAEVVIRVGGGRPLVSHALAKELYAAIDLVIDKAETQLTRHKERVKDHKGAKDSERFDASEGDFDEASDDDDDVD